jgi:hypothetical protein
MYIVDCGGHFWSTKCKELVHQCKRPTKKAHRPMMIKDRRYRLEQRACGPRECGEVPSGWDLY